VGAGGPICPRSERTVREILSRKQGVELPGQDMITHRGHRTVSYSGYRFSF
jgi:hypothetical protein